jgi:hypothetical protein
MEIVVDIAAVETVIMGIVAMTVAATVVEMEGGPLMYNIPIVARMYVEDLYQEATIHLEIVAEEKNSVVLVEAATHVDIIMEGVVAVVLEMLATHVVSVIHQLAHHLLSHL